MFIEDFNEFENNPRNITEKQFDLLGKTLDEFGDLGGVVVNEETKEVISGNQRTKVLQRHPEKFEIKIEEEFPEPQKDGTVKRGFIVNKEDGTKFVLRVVRWSKETAMKANIAANKVGGYFDFDILANIFPEDVLLNYGFSDADLDFMPRSKDILTKDEDTLKDSMSTYLEGNVKQIVLYMKGDEYDALLKRVNKIQEEDGFENHTELFVKAFDEYESNRNSKETS